MILQFGKKVLNAILAPFRWVAEAVCKFLFSMFLKSFICAVCDNMEARKGTGDQTCC
jgi:hypothetical protein